MIPYGRQDINQQDIDAVIEVLSSDFLTQGPKVPEFENSISNYSDAKYAVAVNSATSALHIACLALGVGKGDLVWTSPISFVASANCALYCGADVDFVDIDPISYNLCHKNLKEKLEFARSNNLQLPKVIIPVHLTGQSCDMAEIFSLSKEYGFFIIEDAAHAIGSRYKTKPIGNCQYCDITIFSFHPVKIITTAEGGVATTNKQDLAKKMSLLRSHGVIREDSEYSQKSEGRWYYQQVSLGYNYRMTDLQAALGISQVARLNEFIEKRNVIADYYDNALRNLPLQIPIQNADNYSARHLYIIRLQLEKLSKSRSEIFDQLRDRGVGVNVHFIPIHTQPFYVQLGFSNGDFPEAEKYYSEAISIPVYPQMSKQDIEKVVSVLTSVLMED